MIGTFAFSNKTIEGFLFQSEEQDPTTKSILSLEDKSEQIYDSDLTIDKNYRELRDTVNNISASYAIMYPNTRNRSDASRNSTDSSRNSIDASYLHSKISPYGSLNFPDKTDTIQTTTDVRKDDINTLLLQQNYIYIVGSITCATLLIGAIVIGRE